MSADMQPNASTEVIARVDFGLTLDEFIDFQLHMMHDTPAGKQRAKVMRFQFWCVIFSVVVLAAPSVWTLWRLATLEPGFTVTTGALWFQLALFGLAIALLTSGLSEQSDPSKRAGSRTQIRKQFQRGLAGADFGPQSVTLSRIGVHESGKEWSSFRRWSGGIIRIDETPTLILLCIHPNRATIIPKRAFGTAAEVRAFRDLAEQLHSAAGGMVDPELVTIFDAYGCRCPTCGYSLEKLRTRRCPECGCELSPGMFRQGSNADGARASSDGQVLNTGQAGISGNEE